MAWQFDRAILNLLTRNWAADSIKDYPARLQRHEESVPAPIADSLQSIDAKAAGLLTHVSMMIAGLGLIAPLVATNAFEEGFIIMEIAVYLLISVGCLRCLSVFNTGELSASASEMPERIGHELLLRRELYGLCIRIAIAFTIVVFATLPVLYIWK